MRARMNLACGAVAGLAMAIALVGPGSAEAQNRSGGAPLAGVLNPANPQMDTEGMGGGEDALQMLFAQANDGSGDQHLPFVLARLKKALADQDMLGFLDLVDPAYFETQFRAVSRPGRSPGETLRQFACEFFSICDVSKTYGFNDIVSMDVLHVAPGYDGAGMTEVKLELRMWDGLTLIVPVFYNPSSARISAAVG